MTKIPLPPTSYTVTEQVVFLCQHLKSIGGYDDLVRFLMREEKESRHKPRVGRPQRADVARHGRKVRGGKTYVNLNNPDLRIEEGRSHE